MNDTTVSRLKRVKHHLLSVYVHKLCGRIYFLYHFELEMRLLKPPNKSPLPPFTKGGKGFPLFQRGIEGDFEIVSFETTNSIKPRGI